MSQAPLLSALELSKTYGGDPLFSGITLAIGQSENIALIGPNGSGKSTLLKMFAGLESPDSGEVRLRSGALVAYVAQSDIFNDQLTIQQALTLALDQTGLDPNESNRRISIMAGKAGFTDRETKIGQLSGGWRKRLAVLRALILEPDLLLLDEPTNHLDIQGVLWLEQTLSSIRSAKVFVSHDRYLIENLSQRVVEISRRYPDGYFSTNGGYADFIEARENLLLTLHKNRASLANKVRREVEWLRQGAKARTTKSKYRIERAGEMQSELAAFKLEEKRVGIEFAKSDRKSKDLIVLEKVSKGFSGENLFENVTLTISPGIKLGVVGPNGSGKTTFLRVLSGNEKPDSGRVSIAKNLRISYFDQMRSSLNENATLKEALCPEGDSVIFSGRAQHVAGWAERFIFKRDQLELKVSSLSGGEKARALLAILMLQPADILVFDEPTNDLDIATLEVLEESFVEYPGAIVLVTHDRYLLDRASNIVLGLGSAKGQLFADYSQWQSFVQESAEKERRSAAPRFGGTEKRELDKIERDILRAEKEVEKLQQEISDQAVASDATLLADYCNKLTKAQARIETLYERWQELETLRGSS